MVESGSVFFLFSTLKILGENFGLAYVQCSPMANRGSKDL